MKKIICIILITVTSILSGCNSTSDEEIISSQDFKENYEVSSYGTEEKINTLSDVELTSSEKEYSDLENAKFFLENNWNWSGAIRNMVSINSTLWPIKR